MIKPIVFFLLLFSISNLNGQDQSPSNNKFFTEIYQKGEEALLNGDAKKAIQHFQKALKIQPELYAANRALGVSYELNEEYKKAIDEYETVIQNKPKFSRVLYYEIAQANFRIGNYEQAYSYFVKFDSLQSIDIGEFGLNGEKERAYEIEYIQKTPRNINVCKVAIDQSKYAAITSIQNLGPQINSNSDEYFPYLMNDQKTLYYTSSPNRFSDENLFRSDFKENNWSRGQALEGIFNTNSREGMSTFTKDGYHMYFTACNRRNVMGNCDIQVAHLFSDSIRSVETIKGYSNSEKWESQASISCDGSILYFASNRSGGLGGTDIWYSHRQEDGTWSDAINAGNKINTSFDEEAPFITNDGSTLYFSSTGHLGLGEQDLFLSRLENDNSWGDPINLGAPINTGHRELGFFLSADGKTGYFSSNRPQGLGGMDIYNFELPDHLYTSPITYVEGYVKDSITNKPLQVKINLNDNRTITTDSLGRFFICYPAKNKFDVAISKEHYKKYRKKNIIPEWDNKSFYPLLFLLNPIEVKTEEAVVSKIKKVKPQDIDAVVYFDFDKHNITEKANATLINLLSKARGQNINTISIKGYCDKSGSDAYNFALSMRRANAIASYLHQYDLAPSNISIEGLGEVDVRTVDHLDRRVEIKIILEEEDISNN